MGEEVKKISFGFSKFTKKTQIVSSTLNQIKPEKNNVELIDCFEGKSIKLKNPVQPVDKILVIPLQRHQETKLSLKNEDDSKSLASGTSTVCDSDSRFNMETNDQIENVSLPEKNNDNHADLKSITNKILTLDEIAAKEILEDLNDKKKQDESRIFTVPLTNNPPAGEKESSLEDYENIPVGDFGVAMLRGMGWAPGKGIGKNEKLVTPSLPTLRPKGMGLGADTVLKSSLETKPSNKDLKMVKKSFIRVIAGQHKDSYGQIEGFDDETGRLIVKLALKNISISLNEFMVQLVDDVEFLKNSKVINVSKYEQYKEDESKKKPDKPDVNIHRTNLAQENLVEEHDKQYKGNQHSRDSLSANQSTKSRRLDLDSPQKGVTGKEIDERKFESKKSHRSKHSNKRRSRSRSTSTSSTNEKSCLKMSKDCFSKRARSRSSSTSSANSFRKKQKSSKSKHKYKDSDKRSSRKEKSIRKKKTRSSSSSSSSSSVSTNYDKRNVYHSTEKKMSSSKRYQAKRRSQSPRERESSKKHRNKHR